MRNAFASSWQREGSRFDGRWRCRSSIKGQKLEIGFRPDLVIEDQVVVELKCIEKLLPVHDAQVLTYMRLAAVETGLLINFRLQSLINGIKRFALTHSAVSAVSASRSSPKETGVSRGSESSPA